MSIKQQLGAAVQALPDSVSTLEEAFAQLYRAFKLKRAMVEHRQQEPSVAELAERRRQAMGQDRGKLFIADDFDAPLPSELQQLFEGGAA